MRNIIVGTAGHIDHGKTALVRALTGIETDRLEEEKRRGISIDLGFAHMDLGDDVRLGFVDVPGHERFVKNMLAGAGGVDIVLLVIGADESIKPQTREHFEICRLLGIHAGIVVLTKKDLVDEDLVELVRMEAEEFVKGSFLEGAPCVAVSAKTGEGLEELKRVLRAQALAAGTKSAAGHFRLPVDRSFSMKGFGTVVTGTLISGSVRVEEVEAQPGGTQMRVRGLQVHGAKTDRAVAGQRTALNLTGVEPADLRRGMMLVQPGRFAATTVVDCELDLLASAKPLKHGAPVHFHAWTAETEAEVRLLEGGTTLDPGCRKVVRLLLHEPVLLLPGDRFIVRMFSPVVTIGGGRVLEIAPPRRIRRTATMERLRVLADAGVQEKVEMLVRESPFGMGLAELVSRTGLTSAEVEAGAKPDRLVCFPEPQLWLLDRDWMNRWLERVHKLVTAFHRANPLLPGMPKQELRSKELSHAPAFLMDAMLA
ncbi:MAG: selenocysteine-specific translation elongation factor, partial [Acidobacteriia bacterium]|nr:selenocysteine-specific translation elongation factor [Terriglobia bacterium]